MKKAGVVLFLILGMLPSVFSRTTYEKNGNKVTLSIESTKAQAAFIEVHFFTEGCVKIRSYNDAIVDEASFFATEPSRKVDYKVVETGYDLEISTDEVRISVSEDGIISFFDSKGNRLLLEDSKNYRKNPDGNSLNINQSFFLTMSERLYGLGINDELKAMNLREQEIDLVQTKNNLVAPVVYSDKGWLLLWDNYSATSYKASKSRMIFDSDKGAAIEYFFMFNKDFDKIVKYYRLVTGEIKALPVWAFNYWYTGKFASLETLKACKEKCDAKSFTVNNLIVTPVDADGNYSFNANDWKGIDQVEGLYSVAKIDCNISNDADSMIVFANTKKGKLIDPQAEGGQKFIEERVSLTSTAGFKGFWMEQNLNAANSKAEHKMVSNAYPLLAAKKAIEAIANSEKRSFSIGEGAFTGQNHYNSFILAGNPAPTWNDYKMQVQKAISLSLSGFPFFGSLIGGNIYGNTKHNESLFYQELYARWFQFGVFNPFFVSNLYKPWDFGESNEMVQLSLKNSFKLREVLMPYIYTTAMSVVLDDKNMLRSMVEDFSSDKKVFDINDQLMFGPSILIKPITEKQYTKYEGYEIISADNLLSINKQNKGLSAVYSSGNGDGTVVKRVDKSLNFGWDIFAMEGFGEADASSAPIKNIDMLNFSAAWNGFLKTKEGGRYLFRMQANKSGEIDGSSPVVYALEVNGEEIISGTNSSLISEAHIDLPANQEVAIKVKYKNESSDPGVKLEWITPANVKSLSDMKAPLVDVYLPKGSNWYNFWNGEKAEGGQTIQVAAPFDQIPMFVKEGAIIPVAFNYYSNKSEDKETLSEWRIYTGKDAKYTLYEDDETSFGYLDNYFTKITCNWDESAQLITIGSIEGEMELSKPERKFNFVFVSTNDGIGLKESSNLTEIVYEGKKEKLKIK